MLRLMRCRSCAAEFLSPQPSDAWLAEEYAEYYMRRETLGSRPRAAFFGRVLSRLEVDFDGRRVLDLGAAEGDFVHALLQRWPGARVTAVEGNPEARPFLVELDCRYVAKSAESWLEASPRERFDFVFLFDMLEHVREPLRLLRKLVERKLEDGARIVATFPSTASLSRRALGRLWPQYKVEHLVYFSDEAVSRLEAATGLRRVALRPLTKKFPLDYWLAAGSGFGPPPLRQIAAVVRRALPTTPRRAALSLPAGERLWVASSPDPAGDPGV